MFVNQSFLKTRILVLMIFLGIITWYFYYFGLSEHYGFSDTDYTMSMKTLNYIDKNNHLFDTGEEDHDILISKYINQRQILDTSNLGKILFLFQNKEEFVKLNYESKRFTILIWKYMNFLQNRHLKNYGDTILDPLEDCSVKNCDFTGDDAALSTADAVVVHLQHGLLPEVHKRPPSQIWVFLTDESPRNTFSMSKNRDWKSLAGQFNWSMSYRTESDIPVPYGRVVPLPRVINSSLTELIPNWKEKRIDVLVTVLASNCLKKRMQYIDELSKYVQVDVYGRCSKNFKNSCPGHFRAECKPIETYLFYLAFENTKCDQYITEKAYHNAFSKGAVPIIMGSSPSDCDRLLPPASYLHVDNYKSPKELADHILNLSKNITKYLSYHEWRRHFEVVNEHGYFKTRSKHFCRICEALNYNSESQKTYDLESLALFLDPKESCD